MIKIHVDFCFIQGGMIMSLNGINSNQTASTYQNKIDAVTAAATAKTSTPAAKSASDIGVVYEKSNTAYDSKQIVAQLKADAEARTASMKNLVEKLFTKQSQAFQLAYRTNPDSIWSQIRQGNFVADEQTIAQAKEDVSEDGYWGVKQTSDRILDFAKALSGGDASKIETLTNAIKKGFKKAENLWGDKLPDISQRTYDAVMKGIEDWKAEASKTAN